MKTTLVRLGSAFASLTLLGLSAPASASSHREAPAITEDPAADNTDVWAWVENPGASATIHFVVAYMPFEEPSGGPNFYKFSDDVLYEIHVARGDASLDDAVTYQFRFTTTPVTYVKPDDLTAAPGGGKEFFSQLSGQTQTLTVTQVIGGTATVISAAPVPVAPPHIGPRTGGFTKVGATPDAYEATVTAAPYVGALSNGGQVWAGPRDDGFYVDLGGIFDLANLRTASSTPPAADGLKGFNTHAIALDIPASTIPAATGNKDAANADTLGVWASASRHKVQVLRGDGTKQGIGPWVQVSRLGLPLVNEALIGIQDKDKYNRTTPKTDVANFASYFLSPVIVRDAEVVGGVYGPPGTMADPAIRSGRTDLIADINAGQNIPLSSTGDVLRVNFDKASSFPNGRSIPGGAAANQEQADVTDVLLSLLLTKMPSGVSDSVSNNDADYRTTFPYLARPWRGFDEGHGNKSQ